MRWTRLCATISIAFAIAACAGEAAPPPDGRHTVRGEIVKLPAVPGSEMFLRHESIPDFRDRSGKLVGMFSMTMPFAVGPDVELDGFEVGDRVEFDFEVRWNAATRPLLVTRLAPLAAGTRLEFDPEPQAGGETPR